MNHAANAAWIAVTLLVLSACPTVNHDPAKGEETCPHRLRDTLGFEYGFDCETYDVVPIKESPAEPACEGGRTKFGLYPTDSMLRVCYFIEVDGEDGSTVSAEQCRPIACDSRGDCAGIFPCIDSICQSDSSSTDYEDVLAMCLSPIAWPAQCQGELLAPAFLTRLNALDEACPDYHQPCDRPAECTPS
jgi:hypothetical protein